MTSAFYPGSFDPIHNGHLAVIAEATKAFETVVVGVAHSANKEPFLTAKQRVELIEKALQENSIQGVKAVEFSGLATEACLVNNCTVLVKGVRSGTDLDDEMLQAKANHTINRSIPTLLLPALSESGLISSRYVRQLHQLGSPLDGLVPDCVKSFLNNL